MSLFFELLERDKKKLFSNYFIIDWCDGPVLSLCNYIEKEVLRWYICCAYLIKTNTLERTFLICKINNEKALELLEMHKNNKFYDDLIEAIKKVFLENKYDLVAMRTHLFDLENYKLAEFKNEDVKLYIEIEDLFHKSEDELGFIDSLFSGE